MSDLETIEDIPYAKRVDYRSISAASGNPIITLWCRTKQSAIKKVIQVYPYREKQVSKTRVVIVARAK